MVGRLGESAEAIGAVSIGGILFYAVAIFEQDYYLAWTR